MSSTYGEKLKISIFGQSHGPAIGVVMDGVPAGLKVDLSELQCFLDRRSPGHHAYATSRKENDMPEFLSGIIDGYTCGAPISAIIHNTNTRSGDYGNLKDHPRPGHADYTAQVKYKGFQDTAGGGHFSGRLTAPLCIAGGLCKQWLRDRNIHIGAHISSIGTIQDKPAYFDPVNPALFVMNEHFPVFSNDAAAAMQNAIMDVKTRGDSLGGVIECAVIGLPPGIGDPMFGGMESRIAQIVYGIPAVKGLEFGSGFAGSTLLGSSNNDPFIVQNQQICTATNNAGGILGGITNGMPLIFRAAIKPTPSISRQQRTVSMSTMEEVDLTTNGRHDPCIVPRAVSVIEAAAAIAIFDAYLA